MIYFFSVFKDKILFQHIFDVCWQILFLHICIFKNFFGLIVDHSQTSIKNLQTVRRLDFLDCFGLFFFSCCCYLRTNFLEVVLLFICLECKITHTDAQNCDHNHIYHQKSIDLLHNATLLWLYCYQR